MRGAGRAAGRNFVPPIQQQRATEPDDMFAIGVNPFIGEIPVAPQLVPINDEWSTSIGKEGGVDARDCAAYPASPYCEGDTIRFGPPVGVDFDFRTDGCTTCVYIYPVIGWLRLTPTVFCRRDPNCPEDLPKPPKGFDILENLRPPQYDENVQPNAYKSANCAARESMINRLINIENANQRNVFEEVKALNASREEWKDEEVIVTGVEEILPYDNFIGVYGKNPAILPECEGYYAPPVYSSGGAGGGFTYSDRIKTTFLVLRHKWRILQSQEWTERYVHMHYIEWSPGHCCGMPRRPIVQPPPPLPPSFGKKKRGEENMCCNDCKDSADNTARLLKEIKEIKKVLGAGKLEKALNAAVGIGDDSITAILNTLAKRIGTDSYPVEVPESLLQGTGDKTLKIQSNVEFLHWLTYQFDGLLGQFPIDIEIQDIDPLKEGNQKKTITLPNIAESIAEIYGLSIKTAVNQEVELNMLLRLAAEAIATKNATVVTQDYARANAQFLGYKANFKARELQYNFDFANGSLDPKSKEPIVLEKLLKTVTGYVQGWQLEDKETVVGFLQKLMFSAGIIKAVFFRGKKQQKQLQSEISSMANDEQAQEAKFEAFIKEINDPNSRFNKDSQEKPNLKDETPPDKQGGK